MGSCTTLLEIQFETGIFQKIIHLCYVQYITLNFQSSMLMKGQRQMNKKKKWDNLRYCQIQIFLNRSVGSELFNYFQNCKTYRTSVLTIKCVSFFSINFVLNIFHSNKHLASYAPNIGRSIGRSSCKQSLKLSDLIQNLNVFDNLS